MSACQNEFVDFKAVKQAVSIVQILEHYDLVKSLRRVGDNFSGPCPIHKGKNTTSFRASVSKNCWNCFSACKCGGNILDFVSKIEGVNIREAALLIKNWFNIKSEPTREHEVTPTVKNEKPVVAAPKESEDLTGKNPALKFELNHLDAEHVYLSERGLLPDTIATFGLGYCKKGIHAGRIAIPIHNASAELVAYVGRLAGNPTDDKERYRFPKGFKKGLEVFNLHRAIQANAQKPLVIVEGFFGCMKLWQAGVQRVVSIMGSTLSEPQEAQITKLVSPQQKVVLLFDEDDAGRTCREQVLHRFASKAYVRVVPLPKEDAQPDHLSSQEIDALAIREEPITYGSRKAVVTLGRLMSTPHLLDKIPNEEILAAIARHQSGDWGEVNKHDCNANEQALKDGTRLFSIYRSIAGIKFWIITEADRSATTVMLPEDY